MVIQRPNEIYDLILKSIDDIEFELSSASGDQKLDNAKRQVLKLIKDFRVIEIDSSIEELRRNQEWDTYTIAFYGETNAGKSTIIESLRIYFNQKTKIETQNKFNEGLNNYENKLKTIEQKISNTQITNPSKSFETIKKRIEERILHIQTLELEKKKKSIFYRLISLLNLNSVKRDVRSLTIKLNQLNEVHTSSYNELCDLSDGQIIGDGRSDFTQQTIQYIFAYNEQNFAFLDVPGIEGKESAVIDEIASAVKKAHIVFYVTSNPAPPQKGDENKKGTLEKIKEHLSSQTEVYTIFNKRITNPKQLEKQLVSDEENASLVVLNEKMQEIIGDNYVSHINLSAKLSFLALSKCLMPNSKQIEEKNKFLDKSESADKLLEKSSLPSFAEFLTNHLVQNTEIKIKKSNFNKANNVVKQLILLFSSASRDIFEPLYKQLSKEVQDATHNLNNTLRTTKNKMQSEVEKVTRSFASETRREIYQYIDSNVKDEDFENKLESIVKKKYENLIINLPKGLEKEKKQFQDSINEVMDNFKRRADIALQDFKILNINNSNFTLEINIDNGVDGFGIIGSLVGAGGLAYSAIMFGNAWNPVGWTMFAIGVVTVLVGFGKSMYKFFSDDYKKSEQRKSADENIDRIAKEIKEKISEKLDLSFLEFEKISEEIVSKLTFAVEQVRNTNDYIVHSKNKLNQLSKDIQKEGENNGTNIK